MKREERRESERDGDGDGEEAGGGNEVAGGDAEEAGGGNEEAAGGREGIPSRGGREDDKAKGESFSRMAGPRGCCVGNVFWT